MSKNTAHNRSLSPEKKTILVTGANGQLGMTFRKYEKEYPNLNFVFMNGKTMDITDFQIVKSTFESIKPNYCINCAAYTNVEKAEAEPEKAFLSNAEAVLNLAKVCQEQQTILLHISTDYVFDGQKSTPYTVWDIPNPINVYGASKLKGELYIQEILKEFFIIRTSWLYSKEFGQNFYRTILKKAKMEKVLYVIDNQVGCPTDAANLVLFILDLIESNNQDYGIYHFSDKENMTWYDFAKFIIESNNLRDVDVLKTNEIKQVAERPKYSVLK